MKILVVTPFYKPAYIYGGPTRSIPVLCESLGQLNCDVTVFTTNSNGASNLDVEPNRLYSVDGVNVIYFKRDWGKTFFYSRDLADACNRIDEFDIVYIASNWGYPFIPACYQAIQHSKRFIVSPRNSLNRQTWRGKNLKKTLYHHIIERRFLAKASYIHYTTDLEKDESSWLQLPTPYFVIPNPVDTSEFLELPKRGNFRRKYGISDKTKILLFLGRVDSRKGVDIAVTAFSKIADEIKDSIFIISGPDKDNYSNVIKDIIANAKLQNRVIFTGHLDKTERIHAYRDADIFISTSWYENFGMSIAEAMLSELPVLISDQVGLSKAIKDSNTGIVVPIDIQIISREMKRLLEYDDLRIDFGKRARSFIMENYSPMNIAGEMKQRLETTISNGSQ